MQKTICLPCFGIEVALTDHGGTIKSDLLKSADIENPKDAVEATELTAAVNALESLILAHAWAGIDINTPAYIEGIETVVNKIFAVDSNLEGKTSSSLWFLIRVSSGKG